MLNLLAQLGPREGLGPVLDRIRWQGETPRRIYGAVLGRLPESATLALPGEGYDARTHAEEALRSPEFQEGVLHRTLEAFPELQRLIFVHIPRCAGTDLVENLAARHPALPTDLARPERTGAYALLAALGAFARAAPLARSVLVSGHLALSWFVAHGLCRYTDAVFATVRHPYDIALSQVNYVLQRFAEDPALADADTRLWAAALGTTDPAGADPGVMAAHILAEPAIVPPDPLCTHLGDGTEESALDLVARCGVELVEVTQYAAWLRARWGIESTTRRRQAAVVLRAADLDPAARGRLAACCTEDLRFYDRILAAITRRGGAVVCGSDLT